LEVNRKLYYVYMHRRASDGLPFYIGKCKGYRSNHKINRNQWWERVVAKHGYTIEFLHVNLSEEESKQLEIVEIKKHRDAGYPLVNLTNGGDGNHGWIPSQETRLKISASNTGKSPTQETRDKMSVAKLGTKHTQESKDKITAANLRRTDEENKANGFKRRDKETHGFINLNDGSFVVMPQIDIAEAFNLNRSKVCDIVHGRRLEHKGWKHSKWCDCSKSPLDT